MRPPRAKIIHTTPCSDPLEVSFARALVYAVQVVADLVGRYPGAYTHMGNGPLDVVECEAFVEAVRKDMEAHAGRASVVYKWGEDPGAFETIAAVAQGAKIVVVWLGDAEHAEVVALSARIQADKAPR